MILPIVTRRFPSVPEFSGESWLFHDLNSGSVQITGDVPGESGDAAQCRPRHRRWNTALIEAGIPLLPRRCPWPAPSRPVRNVLTIMSADLFPPPTRPDAGTLARRVGVAGQGSASTFRCATVGPP